MNTPRKRNDLRAEFVKRDLSITDVAQRVGISRGHLSDVLHGRRTLTDRTARDIARETGIPIETVAGDLEPAGVS